MKSTFDSVQYIKRVGDRLVDAIADARTATTPGLVGSAIEYPVRTHLEQILPRGIAVGQGCVMDSWGRTSRQLDIVLYERDICPVFEINNTPEARYYPCEGVIAVGEIKSILKINNLRDSFDKVRSVRELCRYWKEPDQRETEPKRTVYCRRYGSTMDMADIEKEDSEREAETREIYCFILGGRSEIGEERLLNEFQIQGIGAGNATCPNSLLVLNQGWLHPCQLHAVDARIEEAEYRASFRTGTDVAYFETEYSFNYLVADLYTIYRNHKTSEMIAFERYVKDKREGPMPAIGRTMPASKLILSAGITKS